MFGSFPENLLAQFRADYAEKLVRLSSGLYEVKTDGKKVSLTLAGSTAKKGAELPSGTKNRNVSGVRMTDAGAKGRVKGAQAALNSSKSPGAKAAAMKNLNAAQIG
jgi:hypothetical protein